MVASLSLLTELPADTLVGFVFADSQPLGGALGLVDWHLCGLLSQALACGRFSAQLGQRLLIPTFGRLRAKQLLAFGLGPTLACEQAALQATLRTVRQVLLALGSKGAAFLLPAVAAAEPHSWQGHARFCAERVQRGLAGELPGHVPAAFLQGPDPF